MYAQLSLYFIINVILSICLRNYFIQLIGNNYIIYNPLKNCRVFRQTLTVFAKINAIVTVW